MMELSNERIEKILHEETPKKEESTTILRSIYTRYMRLYEQYFSDMEALDDDRIAELKQYHDETGSLVKYYYMDIPQDICTKLNEFESKYSANLLGEGWHEYLSGSYKDFITTSRSADEGEEYLKAEFVKQALAAFYEAMDYVFRDGFGTNSQTVKDVVSGITGLLFGK